MTGTHSTANKDLLCFFLYQNPLLIRYFQQSFFRSVRFDTELSTTIRKLKITGISPSGKKSPVFGRKIPLLGVVSGAVLRKEPGA